MDDLDDDDLLEEVEKRGLTGSSASGGEALHLTQEELNDIETLLVCGQREPARALALELVGKAIGRTL